MRLAIIPLSLALFVLLISSCKKEEATSSGSPAGGESAETSPIEPAAIPAETASPEVSEAVAEAAGEFSVESVPVTTKALPPFPFFKVPDGLVSALNEKDSNIGFDRRYFIAGKKLVPVEGKVFRDFINLKNPDTDRQYSDLEFHRNYENAITALGGKKISETQFTREFIAASGGREVIEKYWSNAAPVPDYEHYSYLIRTPDKEYWIHVSTGSFPTHGFLTVLEKEGMKQSVGFLDAGAMKKALDSTGHVALYINFDVDKATLRPDSQPVITEINKLLSADSALKLSIEGHTDNTGSAEHNRSLSTARARSVLGALVGLGVDPVRLSSRGFGPDKPLASNTSEEGRAANRRVELVKQ